MKKFTYTLIFAFSIMALETHAAMNGLILPPARRIKKVSTVKIVLESADKKDNFRNKVEPKETISADSDDINYIKQAKESSVEMLIKASAMYKKGEITKDKYIEVALQTSQMAEYYNKVKMDGSPSINETKSSSSPLIQPPPAVAVVPEVVVSQPVKVNTDEYVDKATKIVKKCTENDIKLGCKVGLYKSKFGVMYSTLPDPVVTVNNLYPKVVTGQTANISWSVKASAPVTCEVIDTYANAVVHTTNGPGSYHTPSIIRQNRTPDEIYLVKCKYSSGQYGFQMVNVNAVDNASAVANNPTPAPTRQPSSTPFKPSFGYGNSSIENNYTPKLIINGGGSCKRYPEEEFPNCNGGCGPCPATTTHSAKPSSWTFVGAGQDGGCQAGHKLVWETTDQTGFSCETQK